jgi:hypothetical protein
LRKSCSTIGMRSRTELMFQVVIEKPIALPFPILLEGL